MDLDQLKQLSEYQWALAKLEPNIRLYGSKTLISAMDEKVLEQITNVATLPGLVGPAMTMPDAHWGYGFPIGGVAAFDPEEGGIISAGDVGFDISCGIRCLRSQVTFEDLRSHKTELADALYHQIPAGVGVGGHLKIKPKELEKVMHGGAEWSIKIGYGEKADLEYIEENGCISGANPDYVSLQATERQCREMGTLGSGNHYLEVERVSSILDETAAKAFGLFENQILISIHCGSRGFGHQIGTDYLISLAKAAMRLGINLPDGELACAPILSKEGQEYIGAMHAAINIALANRQILTHLTRDVWGRYFPGSSLETLYDVSHNTCKVEDHAVDGKSRRLFIHRKGATRAFGPQHPLLPERYKSVGQPVIIGGSMSTSSYILSGNDETENTAFASAIHGAGRAMSRHQALKLWRGETLVTELEEQQGILIRSRSMRGVAEEAPDSYKDVQEVAFSTEKAGLARRVAELKPVMCVKG